MKVILAHDSFTQSGGAERVFEALHELYPHSPVYTLALDEHLVKKYSQWKFVTSPLQTIYRVVPKFQYLFPLIPFILPFFKLERADVLLSSSSAYLKGLKKPFKSVHVQYCHTPSRFLWSDRAYAEQEIHPLLRPLARIYFGWLKSWDYNKAHTVDLFITNSKEVQARIKKYYGRDSVVVYPFVDTEFWKPVSYSSVIPEATNEVRAVRDLQPGVDSGMTIKKQDYFLLAGRLQPYKNNEMVIRLFNRLGLPLHVVGTGRQEKYLKSIAKSNVQFLGRVDDQRLREEYSGAKGYIFPQMEDFGIMPLEAASCATATIGLSRGGTLETILPGVTGELFDGSESGLEKIVTTWDASKYTSENLFNQARKFSKERFKREINECINKLLPR